MRALVRLPAAALAVGTLLALAAVPAAATPTATVPAVAAPAVTLPVDAVPGPGPVQAGDEFVATLQTAGGAHHFDIEVADTPEKRAQGLMFREEMAADAGMLFDFGDDRDGVSFWMKNTPLPLDMIFIRSDGTITQIAADTTPFSLQPVPSRQPVRFVLEVNAGTAKRIGLKAGDRLLHPRATPR